MEDQNGIISGYLINITVAETGETFQRFSNTTNIAVILMPFTMYTFVLTAENSAGIGPYTEIFSVQTGESGMLNYIVYSKVFDEIQSLFKHVTKASH